MILTVTTHNIELSPAERRRLLNLNQRLQHYFRKILSLRWVLQERDRASVASCSVHSSSGYYRASASADRLGAAMDLAFDKLNSRRRRERAKSLTKRSRAKRGV